MRGEALADSGFLCRKFRGPTIPRSRLFNPPEPHPLDYDWRFTRQSVLSLCNMLPDAGAILAVGTPSVARHLQSMLRPVTLVDRQPYQGVEDHWRIEPGSTPTDRKHFLAGIIDPPWYPLEFCRWTAWTAQQIGIDGMIVASIWPEGTRPGDADEFQTVISWLASWSDARLLDLMVYYERPLFEKAASRVAGTEPLSASPGVGRLLSIRVRDIPLVPPTSGKRFEWKRFVLNDYQLARLRQLVWIYTIFGAVLGSNALFLCRLGVEKGL